MLWGGALPLFPTLRRIPLSFMGGIVLSSMQVRHFPGKGAPSKRP
jgi:hypothetical protein